MSSDSIFPLLEIRPGIPVSGRNATFIHSWSPLQVLKYVLHRWDMDTAILSAGKGAWLGRTCIHDKFSGDFDLHNTRCTLKISKSRLYILENV
jgi:hypothetical protein